MEKRRKRLHYGYVIVICCCLIMGIDVGLSMSCAGIFYSPVSESLKVPVGDFGIYMSIAFICSSLFLSTAGQLMKRFGARKILSISSIILGLTMVAMGFSRSLWEFYVEGALIGCTLASLLYLGFPTLVNTWFRTRVGLMIGICSAASGIGGIIFNPIGGLIISTLGWQAGYMIFGAIILLAVTPAIAILLRNEPKEMGLLQVGAGEEEKPTGEKTDGVPYREAVRMPVLYIVILFAFILMACSTFNLFVPKYTISVGYSEMQSSWAAASIMAGVTLGKLVLGWVNDRNCTMGVAITTLFGVIGLMMLTFFSSSFPVLMAGAFLFGWEYAGCTVQTAMVTTRIFGRTDYARIYSLVSIALAAGGGLSAGGWGLIADMTSFRVTFLIGSGMLLLGAVLGVYALVATRLRQFT